MDKNWNDPIPAVRLSWLVRRDRAQFFYFILGGYGGVGVTIFGLI